MPASFARRQAVLQAQQLVARKPVYLDTETTGMGPLDEIVEICVLDENGDALVNTLVRPRGKIASSAASIHGISDALVREAPAWPEVWPAVQAALAGRTVAIYNAEFDVRMLQQTHRVYGLQPGPRDWREACVMLLYAQFRGERGRRPGSYRWHALEDARRQCGLALPAAHRARADALLARAVLLHIGSAER
jgi:DNA polymerase-3 subunit epsilon